MKNILYFFFLTVFLSSCSVRKKPVFIKLDDIKVLSYRLDTVRLEAKAYFKNENDLGGKISTDEIKVFVNDIEMAQVSSKEFKVPANREFNIPLNVVIPTKRIFENNEGGILGGLLNTILNKKTTVQFKGVITYKVWGYSNDYPINTTQDIKF